jgi:hypothetical protein
MFDLLRCGRIIDAEDHTFAHMCVCMYVCVDYGNAERNSGHASRCAYMCMCMRMYACIDQ